MNTPYHRYDDGQAGFRYGRVYLNVAPDCNVQCNFCDRRHDCRNEMRFVSGGKVLDPAQALAYLHKVLVLKNCVSIAVITGPGDPFYDASRTMRTLRLIRKEYPALFICVATNGLNIFPYLEELARLKVSYVSVTINAVDPLIGRKIYAWVNDGINVYRGKEAAEVLLCRQLEGLIGIKEHKITAKVNTMVIPGVNDGHIGEISRKVAAAGADIMEVFPFCALPGTRFEKLSVPSEGMMENCRVDAARFMPLVDRKADCRFDCA